MADQPRTGLGTGELEPPSFEWEPFDDAIGDPVVPARATRIGSSRDAASLAAAALLVVIGAIVATALVRPQPVVQAEPGAGSMVPASPSTSAAVSSITETEETGAATGLARQLELVKQLPAAPAAATEGRHLVYTTDDDSLIVLDLTTRQQIEVGRFTRAQLPMEASSVRLINGPNAVFALDLGDVGRSGMLSTQLRMARFDLDRDRYAFVRIEDGARSWTLGSLWGPVILDGGVLDADREVILRSERGAVITGSDTVSAVLDADGLRPLPTRLGRVVAASDSHLAGLYCDEFGRCEGRITDWFGDDEIAVPADAVSPGDLILTPDGSVAVTVGARSWSRRVLHTSDDRAADVPAVTTIDSGVLPSGDAFVSDDSAWLAWWLDTHLLVADLTTGAVFEVRDIPDLPRPVSGGERILTAR